MCFFGRKLPTTKSKRPIKGFKDADFRLVFKKNKEIAPWNFFSAPNDVIQKSFGPTHW